MADILFTLGATEYGASGGIRVLELENTTAIGRTRSTEINFFKVGEVVTFVNSAFGEDLPSGIYIGTTQIGNEKYAVLQAGDSVWVVGYNREDGRPANVAALNIQTEDFRPNLPGVTDYNLANSIEGDVDGNILKGAAANDTLLGLAGDDTLIGGADNDILIGGADNDELTGGIGRDVFAFASGHGSDTITDFNAQDDLIRLDGAADLSGVTVFGAGSDTRVAWSGGAITITGTDYRSINPSYFVDSNGTALTGNLNLNLIGDENGNNLIGSRYSETISGLDGDDTLTGNEGNDTLIGGDGDDVLTGGTGNDSLTGGDGADTFRFAPRDGSDIISDFKVGEDRLVFIGLAEIIQDTADRTIAISQGRGEAVIVWTGNLTQMILENIDDSVELSASDFGLPTFGTAENDTMTGGGQADTLYGLGGDDTLIGNDGDDQLIGGAGNDLLTGGNDADEFFFAAGHGSDTITDFKAGGARDTIKLDGVTKLSSIGLEQRDTNVLATWSGGTIILRNTAFADVVAADFGIAEDTGTGGGGTGFSRALTGDGTANDLDGSEDSEIISGYAGNDTINGEGGNDTLRGGGGNDEIYGDAGDDSIYGWKGADIIDGGAGADWMSGGTGNDSVMGGEGADTLIGQTGNDTLNGGADNDLLRGEVGADSLVGGAGNDTLQGGGGNDTVLGGVGDDVLHGWNGNDSLEGESGDDTINGGSGDDTLRGGFGNDVLQGKRGNDLLVGGSGNDVLNGGTGDDQLTGGGGNDVFLFDNDHGDDVITDFTDDDVIKIPSLDINVFSASDFITGTGNDAAITWTGGKITIQSVNHLRINEADFGLFFGDETDNDLTGTFATDLISGFDGDDTLSGEDGDDVISGGAGADWMSGGAGNDTLQGEAGNDTLEGGAGIDLLDGGDGTDTASYALSNEAVNVDIETDIELTMTGGHAEGDSLVGIENLIGSDHGDTLRGSVSANIIEGGGGNDMLTGGADADTFVFAAGHGSDTITDFKADSAADRIRLDGAADVSAVTVANTEGGVTVTWTAGADAGGMIILTGRAHGDLAASDFLDSNGDSLTGSLRLSLTGGSENETLTGGAGADIFMFSAGHGSDTIADFKAGGVLDKIRLEGVTDASAITISNNGIDPLITWAGGSITLNATTSDGVPTGLAYNTLLKADFIGTEDAALRGELSLNLTAPRTGGELSGGAGNDTITGGAGVDFLNGLDGNDRITGGAGADSISGGGGNGADYLDGGTGNDTLRGGDGLDTLYGGVGNDRLEGDGWNDSLYGGIGDDSLLGGSGQDELYGGQGSDSLLGGSSHDTLYGGEGVDTLNGETGGDVLIGGAGADRLIGGDGADTASYAGSGIAGLVGVSVNLGGRGANRGGENVAQFGGDATGDILTGIENLIGSNGNDQLRGDSLNNWLQGGTGNDSLWGEDGNDTLDGGAGDDTLWGWSFNDVLNGGSGNDSLGGETGSDTLDGGAGNDTLQGGDNNDMLTGGADNDLLEGGSGADTFVFAAAHGSDTIRGWEDADTIRITAPGVTSFSDVRIVDSGSDAIVTWNGSGGAIWLIGVDHATLDQFDFTFG